MPDIYDEPITATPFELAHLPVTMRRYGHLLTGEGQMNVFRMEEWDWSPVNADTLLTYIPGINGIILRRRTLEMLDYAELSSILFILVSRGRPPLREDY